MVGNFKGIPFVQNYIFRRTYLQATGLLEEGMDITERQLEYFTQRIKEVLKQAEWWTRNTQHATRNTQHATRNMQPTGICFGQSFSRLSVRLN